jgi:transitional endoplasmic reticulum ATPase
MMLLIGETFQDYVIDQQILIDECAYREVYKGHASDDESNRVFLTIYIKEDMPKNMDTANIHEFDMCSLLQGEHFLKYIDQGEAVIGGMPVAWMATKAVPFQTLNEWVLKDTPSEDAVLDVFCALLEGVQEITLLMRNGGHYNLNPNTVIVSNNEEKGKRSVYIVDMGHVSPPCAGTTEFDTKNISSYYRSRETILGRYSTASSIYSLGLLLGFMLCGRYPYDVDESDSLKTITAKVNDTELPEEIPDALKYIIYKAVSSNMTKRYEYIGDFLDAINDYRKDKQSSSHIPTILGSGSTMAEKIEFIRKVHREAFSNDNSGKQQVLDESPIGEAHVMKGDGFKAVAGMDSLKCKLRRDFVDVLTNKDIAEQYRINVPSILLYGPPGTGKTYISMRLAEECEMECSVINPSDLGSIYVHGSQIMIKELFENAASKAKKNGKGIILIFDEFDAICPQRNKEEKNGQSGEVAELLTQLNNCYEKNIFVIGTTNCLDRIDKAIIRKGRIDELVYVGLPDEPCRKQLFEYELTKRPHEENIDFNALVKMTEGFSPSDIAYLVKESARTSFEACLKNEDKHVVKINQQMLEDVIRASHPSVSRSDVMQYEKMRDELNSSWRPQPRIGFR